jgi:hypothetical protein
MRARHELRRRGSLSCRGKGRRNCESESADRCGSGVEGRCHRYWHTVLAPSLQGAIPARRHSRCRRPVPAAGRSQCFKPKSL